MDRPQEHKIFNLSNARHLQCLVICAFFFFLPPVLFSCTAPPFARICFIFSYSFSSLAIQNFPSIKDVMCILRTTVLPLLLVTRGVISLEYRCYRAIDNAVALIMNQVQSFIVAALNLIQEKIGEITAGIIK